jgi:hypothetical protein
LAFEVVRQPGHPRENLERRHIHVRERLSPSRYQVFYFIFHTPPRFLDPEIYLDIKRYVGILS